MLAIYVNITMEIVKKGTKNEGRSVEEAAHEAHPGNQPYAMVINLIKKTPNTCNEKRFKSIYKCHR